MLRWIRHLLNRKPAWELEYQQWVTAFEAGQRSRDEYWKKIIEEYHIGQPTQPLPQVTAPLMSIRKRAAQNEVRRGLRTAKLEPLEDIYNADTRRIEAVNHHNFML